MQKIMWNFEKSTNVSWIKEKPDSSWIQPISFYFI